MTIAMNDSYHLLQPACLYWPETRSQSCDIVNDMTRLIPSDTGFRSAKIAIDAMHRVRWPIRRVAINDQWFVVVCKLLFLMIATLVLFLWTTIDELNLCKKHISITVSGFEFGSK